MSIAARIQPSLNALSSNSDDPLATRDTSSAYACMLFYRWFAPGTTDPRGRVIAGLIADALLDRLVPTWLDQHHIPQDADRDSVMTRIGKVFEGIPNIVILAGPGDWNRFVNQDDIHRWEWEMSLRSKKRIWLLEYDFTDAEARPKAQELSHRLASFDPELGELASKRDIQKRTISLTNIHDILSEVAMCIMGNC